ncbi:MAG TPA: ABC transporter permease [Chitinophagaceae bacterium]
MFKNYFKTAWRNLNKHKLFSFINIFGLASGMTVCMLALIKIKEAYDYDSFHPDSKRSYRIITNLNRKNGEHFLCASSPIPLSNYLKANYNIVENSTSVYFSHDEVNVDDKKLLAKEACVNADFYKIFGFKLLTGAAAIRPQTVVLTTETAERFFGKENPVGRVIGIGTSGNFLITGVLAKPAAPSHLKFDMLVSMSTMPLLKNKIFEDWSDESSAYTYVQLKAGVPEKSLKTVLQNASRHVNTMLSASANKSFVFDTQPLNNISPGSISLYNITDEPIVPNLIAFALIGISMLLLAFFNYINLTLAHSLDRAREVGIRKVAGALKRHVVAQFLTESVLVAIFAFGLAYFQLRMARMLPTVQNMTGNVTQDKTLWLYFILFTILTGLFAGWIPARIFSAFQPVRVLKGKFNSRLFGGAGLRKTLTVIQFAVSLIAIVTLSVFYRQSIYMATADYGFQREGILKIQLPRHTFEKAAATFSAIAGIESVSGSSEMFGFSGGDTKFIKRQRVDDSITSSYFSVTPSFITDMKLQLIAGENLPPVSSDKKAHFVLVNEEACRALQFKDPATAVGNDIWVNDSTKYIIAGVVKDFHYASFLRPIQPLLLANQPDEFQVLTLKVAKSSEQNIIPSLETEWKKLYPHQNFQSDWYDKELYDQHLHKDDLMFLGLLTVMALSIACLGLLGMVIYITKNRAKEVSIRRVMGADVWQVIIEISKGFAALLFIAICIGLPIGFIIGNQFLQQYAYRVSVNFGIMAGSAATLLFLGSLTIGWQTYKTATANPVKSLRME